MQKVIRLILEKAKGAANCHKAGQQRLQLRTLQLFLTELQLRHEPHYD